MGHEPPLRRSGPQPASMPVRQAQHVCVWVSTTTPAVAWEAGVGMSRDLGNQNVDEKGNNN